MNRKYIVELTDQEPEQLVALTGKGTIGIRRVTTNEAERPLAALLAAALADLRTRDAVRPTTWKALLARRSELSPDQLATLLGALEAADARRRTPLDASNWLPHPE